MNFLDQADQKWLQLAFNFEKRTRRLKQLGELRPIMFWCKTVSRLVLMMTSMIVGCGSPAAPPSSPTATLGEPSSALNLEPAASVVEPATTAKSEAKTDVTLDIKSWDETLALVAEHKGKVVVLDLWSTSCDPCKKEFPHLVEMHNKHGDKVVCLSASCDYVGIKGKSPESYKPQVLEFLIEQKATFQNVLLNVESDVLFEKIDLASIPAVYVFGTDGKLAKRFDNDAGGAEFTYEKEVVPFVEKLVNRQR